MKILFFQMLLLFGFNMSLMAQTDSLSKSVDEFKSALQIINYTYVQSVDNQDLTKAAIAAMLEKLDPHSRFLSKNEYLMQEYLLSGNNLCIGLEFIYLHGEFRVWSIDVQKISPTIGVQIGDKLISINDLKVENLGNLYALNSFMFKNKGKLLHLKFESNLSKEELSVSLNPSFTKKTGIGYAGIIENGLGYIKIDRFMVNTAKEFHKILLDFKEESVKRLILDLRGNQGGYFQAAIDIVDEFFEANHTLVYTKSFSKGEEFFRSTSNGLFKKGKLLVLVDEMSASSSEIIAGAIQDMGRGLIVGKQTYGKALVQRDYFLKDSSVLRLSVAKYYTPSGRCIQKSYKDENEFDSQKYYTKNNRVVYGNGGIIPDEIRKDDYDEIVQKIISERLIESFLIKEWSFVQKHLPSMKTDSQFADFTVSNEIYNHFTHFLIQQNKFVGEKKIMQDRTDILALIKRSIASIKCSDGVAAKYFISTDEDIEHAKMLMSDAVLFYQLNISY
jgi:carboxyl-terminal processing protease